MTPARPAPVRTLFDIGIHAVTLDQAVDACDEAIRTRRPLTIGVVNAAKLVNMRRDPRLADAVRASQLVLADGMSVVWAARLLGRPLPERVAGIDLFARLLLLADQRGYRVYFLGATQAVLDELLRRIGAAYRGLRIAGAHHGYFDAARAPRIAREIQRSAPDLLFVAMTSPRKETFLARFGPALDVPVCHGVGGSFDVFAGVVRRAPCLLQSCGLEWLYRVWQEPRRMWRRYLVTNTLFLGLVLRELLRGLLRLRADVSVPEAQTDACRPS